MTRGGPEAAAEDAVWHAVSVALPPAAAFRLFVEGFGRWWPREFTWSGDSLTQIGIEPAPGGACFELGPYQFRLDWGRVVLWDPPRALGFTWQINPDRTPQPDPHRASAVEVGFHAEGARTRVSLRHHGFAAHGEDGASYREEMGSAMGWPLLLERFARLAG